MMNNLAEKQFIARKLLVAAFEQYKQHLLKLQTLPVYRAGSLKHNLENITEEQTEICTCDADTFKRHIKDVKCSYANILYRVYYTQGYDGSLLQRMEELATNELIKKINEMLIFHGVDSELRLASKSLAEDLAMLFDVKLIREPILEMVLVGLYKNESFRSLGYAFITDISDHQDKLMKQEFSNQISDEINSIKKALITQVYMPYGLN